VRRHVKASSAGSIEPSGKRCLWSLLAALALALCVLGSGASSASAAEGKVVMGTVSEPLSASVHVTGEVFTGGSECCAAARYSFEYSTDEVNWAKANEGFLAGIGGPVSFKITGLKGATKYFVRLSANNFSGPEVFSPGPYPEFETLPADPPAVLSIDDASSVQGTVAKVSGEVERPTPANPDPGFDLQCNFEYIDDAQFLVNEAESKPGFTGAGQAGCNHNPVTAADSPQVNAELTGLNPGTTYHLRLAVSNAGGSDAKVAANTFTTGLVPTPAVSLNPVANLTSNGATFSAKIDPGAASSDPGFNVQWHFECQPACLSLSNEGGSFADDGVEHEVKTDATLEPNTPYTIKIVAENLGGAESDEGSIHTDTSAPTAETRPAFALGSGTEALIGGKVNPRNSATEYWIEYGPGSGAAYPNSIPVAKNASAGSGGQAVFVAQKISGLDPASQYHYRLVAKNATGESKGEDVSFETSPLPEPIQGNCPNAKLRTETSSAALPECRAYEMTTEPDKNAADVSSGLATSDDGNRVGYYAFNGAFADPPSNNGINTYLAQRGAAGWTTRSLMPRVSPVPGVALTGNAEDMDLSSDLSVAIATVKATTAEEFGVGDWNTLLLKPDGSAIQVTAPTVPGAQIFGKDYVGRSTDASHIFFSSQQEFVKGDGNGETQIWEWFDGQVKLVSAQEDGSPFPEGAWVGSGVNHGPPLFNGRFPEPTVVSADGSRVFFGIPEGDCFGFACGVYVREDGQHTRPLSVSQRSGSVGEFDEYSSFAGAAVDGSLVYMTSNTQLTDDATPDGGLYSYNLETDEMHFVGAGGPLGGLDVMLISEDGTRAYFTSPKVLIPGRGSEGASNLYTANDEGGELAYIGDAGLNHINYYVKATPDGGKFAFESTAWLTAYDNAGHREVYLYDAGEGSLRCISCRPDGQAAGGDAGIKPVPIGRPRVLSSDGDSVFFTSSDGLVAEDANGVNDAYRYRDGQVSLISTGTSAYPSQMVDNSADGKNVFFITRDRLVGQDIDGSQDIYDARVDGGFPAPPPPASLCEGEACQGQAHGAPPYVSPGTASLIGRGNTDGRNKKRTHKSCGRKAKKQHSKCAKKTKKHKLKKHQARQASKSGRGE
jgi:hypothetical protein